MALITGGSRGLGLAMALACAHDCTYVRSRVATSTPATMSSTRPIGIRLVELTPQPNAMSTTAETTRAQATAVACRDEPHWESIVVAANSIGSPDVSQAIRVMFVDPSQTWLT